MTAIWTPSRELITPRKRRKVSDWVRMATGILTSPTGRDTSTTGIPTYDTGGCGCCGPVTCTLSSGVYAPLAIYSGIQLGSCTTTSSSGNYVAGSSPSGSTLSFSCMQIGVSSPLYFPSGIFVFSVTGYFTPTCVGGECQTEVVNGATYYRYSSSLAGGFEQVGGPTLLVQVSSATYEHYLGSIFEAPSYPLNTPIANGNTQWGVAASGRIVLGIGGTLTLTDTYPTIDPTTLPTSVTNEAFTITQALGTVVSSTTSCPSGRNTGVQVWSQQSITAPAGVSATLSLAVTYCPSNPNVAIGAVYSSSVNYSPRIVWGVSGNISGKWCLLPNTIGSLTAGSYYCDTPTGTYTAADPYMMPQTITVT